MQQQWWWCWWWRRWWLPFHVCSILRYLLLLPLHLRLLPDPLSLLFILLHLFLFVYGLLFHFLLLLLFLTLLFFFLYSPSSFAPRVIRLFPIYLTHSLIHSFTHSLIHSFTHSLIHSLHTLDDVTKSESKIQNYSYSVVAWSPINRRQPTIVE